MMESLLIILGLPALVLSGFGIWILKRESGDIVRAVGYIFTAIGAIIAVGVVVIMLIYGVALFL